MKYFQLINYLGRFLTGYAFIFLLLLVPAIFYQEIDIVPYIFESFIYVFLIGVLGFVITFQKSKVKEESFLIKESLALVGLGWILITFFGSFPFYLSGHLSLIDAIFESVSGFTTTGSTVVKDIEAFPKTLLFWRAFTHFLGGMGIVVIFIAVLPYLGAGGRLLLQSESFVPDVKFIRPRVKETLKQLLLVYISLNIIQCILLMLFGMSLFDAVCHAFATLASGGFSTRQLSIGAYNSLPIEIITIFFMLCAGTNFGLFFLLYQRNIRAFFQNIEWRVYISIWFFSIVLLTICVMGYHGTFSLDKSEFTHYSFGKALRSVSFTVTSLMTDTGFTTEDYDLWPHFARWALVILMIIGGSAGSTSGGLKIIRVIILFKFLLNRVQSIFQPRVIKAIHLGDQVIDDDIQRSVLGYFALYVSVFIISSLVLCWTGLPIVTSISSVAAAINGCGPGLEYVGGLEDFSTISILGKGVLCILMLMGRLEIYTILVLFFPSFWRSK
ncbi:MAG TPA: TrkH family potassium uptake protein [Candidatus Hydrogenedens sp.]|nr:TrkH family potassium uptake protein [Candidatus Hydrogenedens sp.]